MDPKKIKGTYILRASLNDVVSGFKFTGADRNTELSPASDFLLNLACADINRPVNTAVSLISNNVLNIKAARILTPGASGLRGALNSQVCGSITIIGRATAAVSAESLGGFTFALDHFNEWQDVNVKYLPAKVNENYFLSINKDYTKFFIDDYNIQVEYIGQNFTAVLEMLVDTAGVLDNAGDIV
jgi:hypothetical protein